MQDLPTIKAVVTVACLALLMALEHVMPAFARRPRILRHDAANLTLGLVNAGVVILLFATAMIAVAGWSAREGFGLLHRFEIAPPWVEWVIAIVLFDLWMYGWHVANHKLPPLWRFHAVHHADREMDASSAVRFHTGEIVLSSLARLAVVPLLGLTPMQVLLYEAILQPIILFHHSSVRVPEWLDRPLRWVIPSPRVHRVHHSDVRQETDSNYGSVFVWWDRLFGTFRLRADPATIRYGLSFTGEAESRDLRAMMMLPLRRQLNRGDAEDAEKKASK